MEDSKADGHIYVIIFKQEKKKLALNRAAIQARASSILKMCIL